MFPQQRDTGSHDALPLGHLITEDRLVLGARVEPRGSCRGWGHREMTKLPIDLKRLAGYSPWSLPELDTAERLALPFAVGSAPWWEALAAALCEWSSEEGPLLSVRGSGSFCFYIFNHHNPAFISTHWAGGFWTRQMTVSMVVSEAMFRKKIQV